MARNTFWDLIDATAQEELQHAGRLQTLRDGQALMIQGERGDRVYIVMEGRIKLSLVSDHGVETVLNILGAGDIVGEMEAIDQEPRLASASAKGMTRVLTISGERMRDIMLRHPPIGLVLLRVLSERLRDSAELRSARGAKHQVTMLVHQFAQRYGKRAAGQDEVAISSPLTGEEFASWAGTSRGSAGRAMSWLQGRGVVRRSGREIVVNWQALRQVLRDLGQDPEE